MPRRYDKMRHRRTNKRHAGKSTCKNTRNPSRKKSIQRNENDGHMGTGGNHNNTKNHTWVTIMGTKEQWNDTNRGNIQQSNKTIHKNKVLNPNNDTRKIWREGKGKLQEEYWIQNGTITGNKEILDKFYTVKTWINLNMLKRSRTKSKLNIDWTWGEE